MDERDTQDPLRDLEKRLDKARRQERPARPSGESDDGASRKALALAFRIGLELVVAVFVGAALGWAFDSWLGTQPWGLIVFLFLGFAAGVTNVFRLATGTNRAVGYAPSKAENPKQAEPWDDED
ncbi:MAG TPA: AtpZ/AtpI family protein [Stellaceae bacterium]